MEDKNNRIESALVIVNHAVRNEWPMTRNTAYE